MPPLPRTSLLLALSTLIASCGGGDTVSAEERQALADYEAAARATVTGLEGVGAATDTLLTRLEDGSLDARVDAAIDDQARRLTELERAIGALEDAEARLQHRTYGGGEGPQVHREALLVAAAFVLGATAFALALRAKSDRMIELRMRRDAAAARGDTEGYLAEQRRMAEVGTQAIEQIVTKVIPNPVDRLLSGIRVPGADLSVVITARDAVRDITTLVATEECRVDPRSDECKLGATTAESGSAVEVPAGTLEISVTGAGFARTFVDGVDVAEGERVILEIDPVAHADLPVEGMDDIMHCYGHFGCFDGSSDWLPGECASEGGSPMPGPCP